MVIEIKDLYSSEASYIIETDDNESLFRALSLAEGSGIRTKILNAMAVKDLETGRSYVAGTNFLISDFYKVGSGIKGLVDSAMFIQNYFKTVKEKSDEKGSLLPYEGEYILPKLTLTAFELGEFIM